MWNAGDSVSGGDRAEGPEKPQQLEFAGQRPERRELGREAAAPPGIQQSGSVPAGEEAT